MQKKIQDNFLKQFDCAHLPSPTEFYQFLTQHELACFIQENTLLKQIYFKEKNTRLFCVSTATILSDDFIHKLSQHIQETHENIILYWAWKIDVNHYVPLCFSLIFNEINSKNYITVTTEILNSENALSDALPTRQLINQLAYYLPDCKIFSSNDTTEERLQGETQYFASLTLFLRLSQQSQKCHNEFVQWQQYRLFLLLDPLLNTASFISPALFYTEQIITILKMPIAYKNENNRFASLLRCHTSLLRLLKMGAIAYLAYQKDYFSLGNIPLILTLQLLASLSTQKIPEGIFKTFCFYAFNLFSMGLRLGINGYFRMSNSAIHNEITAPRIIFEGMNIMTKEMIALTIRLPLMMLFCFTAPFLVSQKNMMNKDIQAGFFAMAAVMIQLLIAFIDSYLFQFKAWVFPQRAEENILLYASKDATHLEISNSIVNRVYQLLFLNKQHLELTLKNKGVETQCAIEMLPNTSTNCTQYQFDCQSRFFSDFLQANTMAMEKAPETVTHPKGKGWFCE